MKKKDGTRPRRERTLEVGEQHRRKMWRRERERVETGHGAFTKMGMKDKEEKGKT